MNFKLQNLFILSLRPLILLPLLFSLAACDGSPFGGTVINGDNGSGAGISPAPPTPPALSSVADIVLPDNFISAGTSITEINVDNTVTGNDSGMTYTCYFDQILDGAVDTTNDCSVLPGTGAFDSSTGSLNWDTVKASAGAYEFKIIGVDAEALSGEIIFKINVRPAYVVNSNLIYDFSKYFSSMTQENSNSSTSNNIWANLINSDSSASLNNFEFDANSGWLPGSFSLLYDGIDDYSDHGLLAAHTNFLLTSWLSTKDFTTPGSVLMSTFDPSDKSGFEIRQALDGSGKIDLLIDFESYSDAVLKDTPVSFYKLNETAGAVAEDFGSAGNNGALNAVVLNDPETPISSEPSASALFNGATSNVTLGNPASLQITGDQTLEMWLRPTSFAARRNPYAKAYGGEGTITQETSGLLNYYYGTSGNNTAPYQGFGSVSTLALNTWSHVVLVRDLSGGNLYWYINGVETSTVAATYPVATASALDAFIGQGYVSNYAGQITHVAVYDRALSPAEVFYHYSSATITACSSTTAFTNDTDYHIAAVYDGTNHKLFVNNVEECSINRTYTPSGQSLSLGGRGASRHWNGEVKSFRFYDDTDLPTINTNFNATN